ncbi:hypothetical protein GQ53DRAFT_746890 [Thozetella sp. PMI_491]|nr:hypothetical protein GQ53DRAFT_746890 [Thozetella sp. PMI_491]
MSTTATTTQENHLQDYNIRLSSAATAASPAIKPEDSEQPVQNPAGWYDGHRQVPPFRPVNRNLDRGQRPDGSNPIETAFIFHMLNGVWLKANIAWLWNTTGGRFNKEAFTTKIGGEI